MIFGWDDAIGALMATAGGFIGASKEKKQLSDFKLHKPQYEGIDDAQQKFGDQIGKLPQVADLLGKASDMDNAAVQGRILAEDPAAEANTKAASELAYERSQGGLNPDTVDAIKRANAYAALQGGYAGSSMADSRLGLKTAQARMGAVAQAPQINQQALGMSKELSPVNPDVAATLIAPSAILSRDDQEENYNNDILNQMRLATLGADVGSEAAAAKGVGSGIAGITNGIGQLFSQSGSGWGGSGTPETGMSAFGSSTTPITSAGGWP